MSHKHYEYIDLGGGAHGASHDDAFTFELGHELGHRVHMALFWEAHGMGALFDLSYVNYLMREYT